MLLATPLLALLSGSSLACAAAAPAVAARLEARDGDNDNDLANGAWVTINDEGNPQTTFVPSTTTVSGTPSPVNAPPHDIAGDVFTINDWGHLTTRTGLPPNPTATNANTNQGFFSRCYAASSDTAAYAPFCRPTHNSSIYVGTTYYVTWDPDYFNKTSSASASASAPDKERWVSLRINYFNETDGSKTEPQVLDTSYLARWGYLPLKVEASQLRGKASQNVTLQLISHEIQNTTAATNHTVELPVVLTTAPLHQNPPTPMPKGMSLLIALPVTFGAIALLVVGLCLWHAKTRRIELGNIMSRSRRRKGYTGRRHRDLFRRKDHGIQLHTAPILSSPPSSSPPPPHLSSSSSPRQAYYRDAAPDRPSRRLDSDSDDALGSLAGSPVGTTFEEQPTTGQHNAFREEMRRQHWERRGGDF